MKWFDPRIIIELNETEKYALLFRDQRDRIWFPDPYLISSTDINVPKLSLDPLYLRIYKSGMVEFSVREEIKAVCPMNFFDYPVSKCVKKSSSKVNACINIFRQTFKDVTLNLNLGPHLWRN